MLTAQRQKREGHSRKESRDRMVKQGETEKNSVSSFRIFRRLFETKKEPDDN